VPSDIGFIIALILIMNPVCGFVERLEVCEQPSNRTPYTHYCTLHTLGSHASYPLSLPLSYLSYCVKSTINISR